MAHTEPFGIACLRGDRGSTDATAILANLVIRYDDQRFFGQALTATPCASARVIAGQTPEPAASVAAGSVAAGASVTSASVAAGAWVAVGAAGLHAEKAMAKIVNTTIRE